MGNQKDRTEDLQSINAIKKIKEIVYGSSICMFTTHLSDGTFNSRPMETLEADEDGCLWFLSSVGSRKNAEIYVDDRVQLCFMHHGKSEYLSLSGRALIIHDLDMIEERWSPLAKPWFIEAKRDPGICLIKVEPEQAHYWDTRNGRIVSLVKSFAATVSGNSADEGIEGLLEVH